MIEYCGGHAIYGIDIGIIVLETYFPRLMGDMGDARTFNYPVAYRIVQGAIPRRIVGGDRSLLNMFLAKANELESLGVKAITTNCGYMARFQKELNESVDIPVFTSSLIQVPMVSKMLNSNQIIGIIVADKNSIDDSVFLNIGWSSKNINVVVRGMEKCKEFSRVVLDNAMNADFKLLGDEVYKVCHDMKTDYPEIGAIVFECTDLSPFSRCIKKGLNIPVFDIVTLTNMVQQAVCSQLHNRRV